MNTAADARTEEGAALGESGAPSRLSDSSGSSTVTVWRIALDPVRAPAAEAVAELSDDERVRAARFATEALKSRWLHGHVATRRILAAELGVAPQALVYGAAAAGKPFVESPVGSGLEFSFSDSGELALLAVGRGAALGVDVELRRPLTDLEGIAERFFALEEQAALFALPESEREAAFYRLWTRKEAYIKAIGIGLGHPLARFVMSVERDDVRLVAVDRDTAAAACWSVRSVDVGSGYDGYDRDDGYEGALVVARPGITVITADWQTN